MTRRPLAGRLALAAAAAAVLAVAAVALLGGGDRTLRAQFANAGGLVEGGLVQVAGRQVGSISEIRVTHDGQADVELEIDDEAILPLHEGTRATIRSLGQAGITNRFVALSPGPRSAPELPDGATLPAQRTSSVVALDAVLASFGPRERANLKRLVARSADVFAGSGARWFNAMLGDLDPALAELDAVAGELARDRASIAQVIHAGRAAAGAIASRREDLRTAIGGSARAMTAIAAERAALAGVLDRAPAVLDQSRSTLRSAGVAVAELRPALREVPAAAGPLGGLLERSRTVLPRATPAVAGLTAQLPDLERSLRGLRPLRGPAVRALRSAAVALRDARPIVRAARFYGSDFVLGILNGLVGAGAYNYNRWGHYERLDFVQPPQSSITGFGSTLLQGRPLIPGIFDLRTQLTRRCPGGNVPPAIDGSTPWRADESLCTPGHDMPAGVNGR